MIAEVIVDISTSSIDKIFDYIAIDNIEIGCRVLVPFGRQKIEGIVIAFKETSEYLDKLKPIIKRLDTFVAIKQEMINLMWYMKKHFNLRLADVLRLFIPTQLRGGKIKPLTRLFVELNSQNDYDFMLSKVSKKQQDLLEFLKKNGGDFLVNLKEKFSDYAIKKLKELNFVSVYQKSKERKPFENIAGVDKKVTLNEMQVNAVEKILNPNQNKFLLHGVTGSGKTEIYLAIIKKMLLNDLSSIMLVPEISLTPQMLNNLRGRFGENVAILHSGLSHGERLDEWTRIHKGIAKVVVGARSAIFAPMENVGVIIIDEEHEQSYVSENNPRYNTHEVAKWRAMYNNAKLILGSATPSIDTYFKSKNNEFEIIELNKRVNNLSMPEIEIINMSHELRLGNRGIFSDKLKEELIKTINEKKQAMIYINRRGFSSFVMCKKCGHVVKCDDCDVSLTYHKEDNLLKCHYCGKRYRMLTHCPKCGDDKIRFGRVGTEQVVGEVKRLLPKSKVLRLDNDTTRTKTAYYDILSSFGRHEADVLVGTQMIAKGHDFEDVNLVGIIDADMSLYYGDYTASEKTFQLMTQVSGRAGRATGNGKVILQSYSPNHYTFTYSKDYDYKGFYNQELNLRKVTKFPPFSKIVRILVTATEEKNAIMCCKTNYECLKKLKEKYSEYFLFFQAMKSPIQRIENKYRYQILMRIAKEKEEEIIQEIYKITNGNLSKKASLFVEINPQNLS